MVREGDLRTFYSFSDSPRDTLEDLNATLSGNYVTSHFPTRMHLSALSEMQGSVPGGRKLLLLRLDLQDCASQHGCQWKSAGEHLKCCEGLGPGLSLWDQFLRLGFSTGKLRNLPCNSPLATDRLSTQWMVPHPYE